MPERVKIRRLALTPLHIPFKAAFRHASAERTETSSLWVEAASARGAIGYGESCPRPYVTGETLKTAREFFARHDRALCDEVHDLASLRAWMARQTHDLDANPAAWCALELALLDLLAKENGETVEALLSLPPLQGRFTYTAVVGDAGRARLGAGPAVGRLRRRHGFIVRSPSSGGRPRDRSSGRSRLGRCRSG
jgi:L-alanine-DL-glutamate epimerase-like enolase superfamily enzyme